MSAYYKNTLVIDFTVVSIRPKLERVREFVFEQMGITMPTIKNLQTRITKSQVLIEVESAELAEELVIQQNMKHTVEHEGKQYQIPLYTADNIKEVRIFDLPCQMPNGLIARALSGFGEVISVRDDIWKDVFTGLPNGTRLVRMKLHKQIPSYFAVAGVMSYITYSGQTRTCKHCAHPLHIGKSCGQNRKELIEGGMTAAEILRGKPAPRQAGPVKTSNQSVSTSLATPTSPVNSTLAGPSTSASKEIPIANEDQAETANSSMSVKTPTSATMGGSGEVIQSEEISDFQCAEHVEETENSSGEGELSDSPVFDHVDPVIATQQNPSTSEEHSIVRTCSQPDLRSSSQTRKTRSNSRVPKGAKFNAAANGKRPGSPKDKDPKGKKQK